MEALLGTPGSAESAREAPGSAGNARERGPKGQENLAQALAWVARPNGL
jgi:hypothetical protein